MANEIMITINGNLTADPELHFTSAGVAVAKFAVASTPRNYDKDAGAFVDGETVFKNVVVWRQAAENATETLRKGMRVLVYGRLKARSYEKDGQTRHVDEIHADAFGPDLSWATAQVTRNPGRNANATAAAVPADEEAPF